MIGEDGTWTIEGVDVTGLADGAITFQVTATDSSDNTADATATATKDTMAPEVALVSVTDPINAANAGATNASGTGEVGATITLVVTDENDTSTTVEYTTVVGEDGTWSIEGVDVTGLADGTLTYQVTATDAAGNSAVSTLTSFKDTVAPAIAITNVNTPITIATQHATGASGTGDVGATITVVVSDGTNSTAEYTTSVAEDGTWSIEGIDVSELADGTITYTATASNSAGNSAQAGLDATKTTVAIVAITEPINADSASNVAVSGTGEVGATITLVVTDENDASTTTEYTTVVGEDGTWTIEGVDVSELADGTLTFTATATDASDNTAESTRTATKDTLAPEVILTSVTEPINADSASNVAVSGTGEVGATITLVVTDENDTSTTVEYTTVVGEDGTWTIEGVDVSELADGTLTFTATATDAAGNSADSTLTATKEAQAEPASVTTLVDTAMADEEYWT